MQKGTLVLGGFVNRTGDSVFDGTLQQGLSVQLEQSPQLRVLPEEQIHDTLRMMGRADRSNSRPMLPVKFASGRMPRLRWTVPFR